MASNQEVTIPLRYWVDNEQKRVVMAEASGDFVDVLFSFLTLPLGTIFRLESDGKFPQNQSHQPDQPVKIGCIKNLYQSVQELSTDVFRNNICKGMLRSPRNPLEASCRRLKLKVDDTPPTKYFTCNRCSTSTGSDFLLSTFDRAKCYCGEPMEKEMELLVESIEEPAGGNGVFVKGDAMFLICDDLTVLESSPGNSVQPLLKHGIKDSSNTREIHVDVGMNQIFSIIKQALTSESPLSDVFLPNSESQPKCCFSPCTFFSGECFSSYTGPSHWKGSVEIKVMVSKSKNKILFAEAGGDFVDYLVSFLTTPLGSILNLMNGKLSSGSIDNLYTSVKKLDPSWFIGSSNKSLLNPRVAPQYGCKSIPLNASQEDTPKYWYGIVEVKDNMGRIISERTMISKKRNMLQKPAEMKLFDPRSSDGARGSVVGFMKRPCTFVVRDDLQVATTCKQTTTTSSIGYLRVLESKLDDLEEHFVEIRSHEALKLLRASLISDEAVLTRSLFHLLRKWKYQRCIPLRGLLRGWKKKRVKKKNKKEKLCEIISVCR